MNLTADQIAAVSAALPGWTRTECGTGYMWLHLRLTAFYVHQRDWRGHQDGETGLTVTANPVSFANGDLSPVIDQAAAAAKLLEGFAAHPHPQPKE